MSFAGFQDYSHPVLDYVGGVALGAKQAS
jgi:hypothetical protein